jgi:Peptidase M50B-like
MFTKKTNQTEEIKITAKTREYLNAEGGQVKTSTSPQSVVGLQAGGEQSLVSKTTLNAILIASVISIVVSFLPHPYNFIITYPMNIFVTFIHEGCHALMTLLTGGWVMGIGINPDTSGVTNSTRGIGLLIYPAGYIGSTVFGALLIRLMQRGVPSKTLLYITSAILALVTLATIPGFSLFGIVFGAFLTSLCWFAAKKLPKPGADNAIAILAVQCILGSLLKLHLVFQASLNPLEKQDPNLMANATMIPAPVWSVLWAVTSLAALWYVLRPAAWKNSK